MCCVKWYDMFYFIWYGVMGLDISDMIWFKIWSDTLWYDMMWFDMKWHDMICYELIN